MAFQTRVLRDGEWITETVQMEADLAAIAPEPKPLDGVAFQHPSCGLLSRTIVKSPLVNTILPVRLRSIKYNDIAYIGDHFLEIKELRDNGQSLEVMRYDDFPSRIRNAVVFGKCPEPEDGIDVDMDSYWSTELGASQTQESPERCPNSDELIRELPPQVLVLMFETGEMAFVFLEESPSDQKQAPEMVVNRFASPGSIPFLGAHLAIDPSSRYIAATSMQEVIVVYELKSWTQLHQEYRDTGTFNPIIQHKAPRGAGVCVRTISAVINSVQFLYPRPQDESHIILHMTICRNGSGSKPMTWNFLTYDWEVGDSLEDTFSQPHIIPTRLPDFQETPSFIIPLRFQNAAFIIFKTCIGLLKHTLSCPEFEASPLDASGPSELHHGTGKPLWVTWARPFRRSSYFEKTDIIYLAREDGIVMHVEVDAMSLMHSVTEIGCLDTNISKAFTTSYDAFSDLLIIGGDSGCGGIWKLEGRAELERVGSISNWSPVVDIATTNDDSSQALEEQRDFNHSSLRSKPDRIFFASGRGIKGSLSELKFGLQARIGLDMELGEPIRQAWLFKDHRFTDGSMCVILALPHSSAVLRLRPDLKDVETESPEFTQFDLSSRTLFASRGSGDRLIQITEQSIALITPSQNSRHMFDQLFDVEDFRALHAACVEDTILVADTSIGYSRFFSLKLDQMNVNILGSLKISAEVTCLSLFQSRGKKLVVLGVASENGSSLILLSLEDQDSNIHNLGEWAIRDATGPTLQLEALTSITALQVKDDEIYVAAGTRCGHLLTLRVSISAIETSSFKAERIGTSSVQIFPGLSSSDAANSVLACCDNNLINLAGFSLSELVFKDKSAIWPMDVSDSSMQPPQVHFVFSTESITTDSTSGPLLLMLAGTRMLLADLSLLPGPIHRSISLGGTPTRVLYSQVWQCLIAAVTIDSKSTLLFLDPDSGETISTPVDKDMNPVECIQGLGLAGDKVLGLHEWHYVKDGQKFCFLIVILQGGSLLIVSVKEDVRPRGIEARPRNIRYWTRYRRKGLKGGIYAVVPDNDGLVYCAGCNLYWDVLDLTEKKMKTVKELRLESPAISLTIREGKVLALTAMHSLQVIDHRSKSPAMEILHTDAVTRMSNHMINVTSAEEHGLPPVAMISDCSGKVAGLMIPWDHPKRELIPLFAGNLCSSVRRFVQTRCQPLWPSERSNQHSRFSACFPSTSDGSDILGVSLDGTLYHFSLLGVDLWRVLCLLQNLMHQRDIGKNDNRDLLFDDDLIPEENPANMHIDGDVLSLCLRSRILEQVVMGSQGFGQFSAYLDQLGGGIYTKTFRSAKEEEEVVRRKYFDFGYELLSYLLAPIL